MDCAFRNTTKVERDEDQQYNCICAEPFRAKYAVCIKDGSHCVRTTEISCLTDIDIDAEAVLLRLQAGFRPSFARNLDKNDKTFLECMLDAIENHVSGICSELGIHSVGLIDWKNALFNEIKRLLLIESALGKDEARPITGNIYFDAAGKAFNAHTGMS